MGTEIFKKIADWHRENRQYDGFIQFEAFGLLTVLILVNNICCLSTDPVDWLIVLLNFVTTMFYVERWMGEMKFKAFQDFTRELMEADHNLTEAVMARCEAEHRWLVSANRRRKSAEKKLRRFRRAYRAVVAAKMECEKESVEFQEMLLTAYAATFDYSGQQLTNEDLARIKEAQRAFNKYMQSHYPEMARRKFWRDYKQDVFDCLFFGDSAGDPNSKSH